MNESPRKHPVTLEDLLRLKRAERPPEAFWAEFERSLRVKQTAAMTESAQTAATSNKPALASLESAARRAAPVALEDLLRLKRAERPPAEFWSEFERGMRAKQLAAIVEPRPWWAPFIRFGARVSRYQLPVGATAILAITILTLREYQTIPVNVAPRDEPAVAFVHSDAPAMDSSRETLTVAAAPSVSSVAPAAAEEVPNQVVAVADISSDQDQPTTRTATMVGASSHLAPAPAQLGRSALAVADVGSGRLLVDGIDARHLKSLSMAHDGFELNQFLDPAGSIEDTPRPPQQEPLARLKVPGSSRRFFGGEAMTASVGYSNDSALRDDQSASRLTEDRLNEDAISRVKLGGDRVNFRF